MLAQATTSPTATGVIVAIVIIAIVIAIIVVALQQRSKHLRERFGPEYDRTVKTAGSPQRAEAELSRREKRVKGFALKPLPPSVRDRYADEWDTVQARFVDDPSAATADADRLVMRVMRDRGYPMESFDQRAADLSVDHASDVTNYRLAHDISQKNDHGAASTEELRQALVHYRALFESLLEPTAPADRPRASA